MSNDQNYSVLIIDDKDAEACKEAMQQIKDTAYTNAGKAYEPHVSNKSMHIEPDFNSREKLIGASIVADKSKKVIVHRNGNFTPEGDKMIHNLESALLKKRLRIVKNIDGSYKLDEKGQIEVKLMKSNFTKPKKKRK